ncbi:MAG: hypothetical protein HYZ26_05810 [Chloroflexi bacterium]|nr:hypothetical protein [Chloroflexota bacterium]
MHFLQQGPAETTDYLILGLAFVFIPMALHVWSLVSRRKRLESDLAMMEEMKEK